MVIYKFSYVLKISYVLSVVDDVYIAQQFAGVAQRGAQGGVAYVFNMERELFARFHLENEWLLGKQM